MELASLATDERKKLSGFKILGVFPFYLNFIKVSTHIKLTALRERIKSLKEGEPDTEDFYDPKLQKELFPLIVEYCTIGLLNGRRLGGLTRFFLRRKIKDCGHFHLLNLYLTIQQLNEPAFFLTYWKLIKQAQNTLLKEEKQS